MHSVGFGSASSLNEPFVRADVRMLQVRPAARREGELIRRPRPRFATLAADTWIAVRLAAGRVFDDARFRTARRNGSRVLDGHFPDAPDRSAEGIIGYALLDTRKGHSA